MLAKIWTPLHKIRSVSFQGLIVNVYKYLETQLNTQTIPNTVFFHGHMDKQSPEFFGLALAWSIYIKV